jgi:hypothetical protein
MKGYGGPGAAVAAARDAYRYLEVKCDGGGTHNTVDLTIIRRPRERQSGKGSSACAASRARSSAAIPTSAAIWYGCDAARVSRQRRSH